MIGKSKIKLGTKKKRAAFGKSGVSLGKGPKGVSIPVPAPVGEFPLQDDPTPCEASVAEELTEMQIAFRARQKKEKERFVQATDSEYWFCVCFQTREQKEEFLQKMDLMDLGDKYLDGLKVAEALDVEIESPTPKMPKYRLDKKLLSLT